MAKKKEVPVEQEQVDATINEDASTPVSDLIEPKAEVEKKANSIKVEELIEASRYIERYLFQKSNEKLAGFSQKHYDIAVGLNIPFRIPLENPQGFYIVHLLYIGPEGSNSGLTDPMGRPIASKAGYKVYPAQAVVVSKKDFGKMLYLDFDFYINLINGNKQHDRSFSIAGRTLHIIKPHEVYSISEYDVWFALGNGMIQLEHLYPNKKWSENAENAETIYRVGE